MQGSSINDSVSQASFIHCFFLDFLDLNHLQFSYRGVSVVHAAPFSPQNMFLLPIYSNLFLDNRSSARLDASGGTPSRLLFDDNATHLTGIKNKLVARWFHTVSVLFVLIKVVSFVEKFTSAVSANVCVFVFACLCTIDEKNWICHDLQIIKYYKLLLLLSRRNWIFLFHSVLQKYLTYTLEVFSKKRDLLCVKTAK